MKVSLLNEAFPPVIDGTVNVVMNYANYLMRDHGAEVMVGTPRYPGGQYGSYPYRVVAYPSFDTASVMNGYRTGNPVSGRAIAEMADFEPDIIHAHCPATATIMARVLRETTGAPIIFTYHTKYDIDLRREMKIRAVAEEGIRAMVKNIEACDDIWVVSRGAGESLKALGFQGDYRVMSNGVDFARGRVDEEQVKKVTEGYDLPDGVPVWLYVGRLITYKGLPIILDALKMLADKGKDFRMVFVGKGPDRELLESRARELGLMGGEGGPAKCIFTGPVYDRDELRAWNTRADLFLFPSTFDTNGLVVREAAACGLASVLIRDSCAAEGITDDRNGFIIDESAEAMAAFLERTLGHSGHLHEVGQRAMEEIYLSWQDAVALAYRRYEHILARKEKGILPRRKKQASDLLVSMVSRNVEEYEKIRNLGREMMGGFRESAVGMLENFQEETDRSELFWNRVAEEMRSEMESVRTGIRNARTRMSDVRAEMKNAVREEIRDAGTALSSGYSGLKRAVKKSVDSPAEKPSDEVN